MSPSGKLTCAEYGKVSFRTGSVQEAFLMVADKAKPLVGASPFCRCHTQTFSSGTQKKPPRKSWSGWLMPRYLAPQETNWMLQFGPWPKQTMSGGLGGVWLAGAAGAGAEGLV